LEVIRKTNVRLALQIISAEQRRNFTRNSRPTGATKIIFVRIEHCKEKTR